MVVATSWPKLIKCTKHRLHSVRVSLFKLICDKWICRRQQMFSHKGL